jgi:hypothetical protein
MERPEHSDVGYPEEQPSEVADEATTAPKRAPRRESAEGRERPGTRDDDEDTATGNRNAAGGEG